MTDTTVELTDIDPDGDLITDWSELDQAKPGWQFHWPTSADVRYLCVAPGTWRRYDYATGSGPNRTVTGLLQCHLLRPGEYRWDRREPAEQCGLSVGDVIVGSAEVYASLPVGSRVSWSPRNLTSCWEKDAVNTWSPSTAYRVTTSGTPQRSDDEMCIAVNRTVLRVGPDLEDAESARRVSEPEEPAVDPTVPKVGSWITNSDQHERLPIGSVLRTRGVYDYAYIKVNTDNEWEFCDPHPPHQPYVQRRVRPCRPDFSTASHNQVMRIGPAVEDAESVSEGLALATREQFAALPIGSVIHSPHLSHFIKVTYDRWLSASAYPPHRALEDWGPGEHQFSLGGFNTVVRVGPALDDEAAPEPVMDPEVIRSEAVQRRVEQAKREVRDCISSMISDKGAWEWAAQGAWWLLGVDDLPSMDGAIQFGSSFGLPIGSYVRHDSGRLYLVDSNEALHPTIMTGFDGSKPWHATEEVTVVALGSHIVPEFTGRNDFLHQVWEEERKLREMNNWCSEVEEALIEAGLADPGEGTPGQPPAPPEPPYEPEVGERIVVEEKHIDALRDLPRGSVISGGSRWFMRNNQHADKGNVCNANEWVEHDGDQYNTSYFLDNAGIVTIQFIAS